jgi:hypothetical protein
LGIIAVAEFGFFEKTRKILKRGFLVKFREKQPSQRRASPDGFLFKKHIIVQKNPEIIPDFPK